MIEILLHYSHLQLEPTHLLSLLSLEYLNQKISITSWVWSGTKLMRATITIIFIESSDHDKKLAETIS